MNQNCLDQNEVFLVAGRAGCVFNPKVHARKSLMELPSPTFTACCWLLISAFLPLFITYFAQNDVSCCMVINFTKDDPYAAAAVGLAGGAGCDCWRVQP